MTTYNKSSLAAFFQTGDVPTGTDYENFIDSCVNVAETSAQTMNGPLVPTELITARVSAGNGVFTGTLRVDGQMSAANANFNGTVSANNIAISSALSVGSLNVSADVSAATGTVYASAMRSTNGLFSSVGIVSAAGTAQSTAALLTNVINHGKGIVDGSTTGFTPLANRTGLVQYLFNEGASANLWPPTGGKINGLAANAAYSIATSSMVTIVHIAASAYAVG